jgi:hypothetical protein
MIDLKITKNRFVNHFYYAKWLYVGTILAAIALFSIVFTVTAPVIPKEFKVDINVIGGSIQEFIIDEWEEEILALLPEDQQKVSINALPFSGGEGGYSVFEVLAARMAAKEDDILIMKKDVYEPLAAQGAFIPLDEYAKKYTFSEEVDLESYKLNYAEGVSDDMESHLFGVPLNNALGLVELSLDPREYVVAVLVYTQSVENALTTLDYLLAKTELPTIE